MSEDVPKTSEDFPKSSVSHEDGNTKEHGLVSSDFPTKIREFRESRSFTWPFIALSGSLLLFLYIVNILFITSQLML